MLSFTVRIDEGTRERSVHVVGEVGVANATEFSHLVHQLNEAVGAPLFDLTEIVVLDEAGRAAVRNLIRDTEEFGGTVRCPAGWEHVGDPSW